MKALLITVGVLIVLLVGVDIAGRQVAQVKAADAIAAQAPTTVHPDVTIHGLSFLAQALPGRYSHITVDSGAIDLGTLTGVTATVELYDVTYPLSDALSGTTDHLVAGRADVRATVPLATLTSALRSPATTLSAGASGGIRLTRTVSVAGQSIPISADLTLTLVGQSLQLTTTNIQAAGIALPAQAAALVRAISLTVPLDRLPVAVSGATIGAVGDTAVITASATDVRLANLR